MNLSPRHKLGLIVGLTLLVRLLMIAIFPGPNYFEGISSSYLEVANNVLAGKGTVLDVDVAPVSSQESKWSSELFIDRPLGYVFLILVPLVVVPHPIAVQVFQALLACLSGVFLFRIGIIVFSEKVAFWSALAYALWPLSARFEIALLPDSVMAFFLLLTLWLYLRALTGEKSKSLFWSGLVCGAGMTVRPDILLLPIAFLAGSIVVSRSHFLRRATIFLAGTVLILAAHTMRNYAATDGEFVPLGLGNGISLWEGISQFGDTLGTVYGDERMVQREGYRSWAYPDGVQRDRRRFREALRIIGEHPLWYAGVILRRIPVLLTPDWIMSRAFAPSLKEYLDSSKENSLKSYLFHHPWASALRFFLIIFQYGSLGLGLFAVIILRKNALIFLPALIIFYYIVIHIPTNTEARYFYPVIPVVLLLASAGWDAHRKPPQQEVHAR